MGTRSVAASTIGRKIIISRLTTRAATPRFGNIKTLQKFSSVHAQIHNHFTQERHLVTRQIYKQRRLLFIACAVVELAYRFWGLLKVAGAARGG